MANNARGYGQAHQHFEMWSYSPLIYSYMLNFLNWIHNVMNLFGCLEIQEGHQM